MSDLTKAKIDELFAMCSTPQDLEISKQVMELTAEHVMGKVFSEQEKLKKYQSKIWQLNEAIRKFQVNNQIKDDSDLGVLCWSIRNYIDWANKNGLSDLEVHIGKDTDYKSGEGQYKDKLSRILERIKTLKTKKGATK